MRSGDFPAFVEDQLDGLEGLRIRRMFGGHGMYLGDCFFGIIARGRLYFRTGNQTRARYEAAGMGPFQAGERQILKRYYEVPGEVLECPVELRAWAMDAARLKDDE